MADNKKINEIINLSRKLSLQIRYSDWGKPFFNGLHDYRITITLDNKKYTGIGIHNSENIAFLKAFSESIERYFCYIMKVRTGGVAAEWNPANALYNSTKELFERDIFLCHYLSGVPGKEIKSKEIDKLNKIISANSRSINVFQLFSINNYYTFICVGNFKNKGFITGLGISSNFHSGLRKSIIECLFCLMADNSETLVSILREPGSPSEHYNYHTRSKKLSECMFLKNSNEGNNIKRFYFDEKNISTDIWSVNKYVRDLNLYVAHSSSNLLQEMFFGPISEEKVNFSRIQEFNPSVQTFSDLERVPHPMG